MRIRAQLPVEFHLGQIPTRAAHGKMIPLVKTSFPESTSQFLLKGNLPSKYNVDKKNTLEISGPGGGAISVQHTQADILDLVQTLKIAKENMPVIDIIPEESDEE